MSAAQQDARRRLRRHVLRFAVSLGVLLLAVVFLSVNASAAGVSIDVQADDTAGNMGALEIIVLFAFLSILPSVVLMCTSFTRIVVVLGFLRNAMGTQQAPPNMVLVGLAVFMTLFIMTPTINEMNETAYQPYKEGRLTSQEALEAAQGPVKKFMLTQTDQDSLDMFLEFADITPPEVEDRSNPVELIELPLTVITPAFIVSELSRAFMMGFLIYLPFLVVDVVVSSILMSMGMVMLPPAMISLPFKILLFVIVDGWGLMLGTLLNSFTV